MPFLPEAQPPAGMRLYAIGDVHGMLDRLREVHRWIEVDLTARPAHDWRIIHIGDYIDRGPDSAGVLRFLSERAGDPRCLAIRGNHDDYMTGFLADPGSDIFADWLRFGTDTFQSFGIEGVSRAAYQTPGDRIALAKRLAERAGPAICRCLAALPLSLHFGDFFFAHAGIRPGIALTGQDRHDLMWIREPFLSSTSDLGAVVIHGHTPTDEIDVQRNRIGIDTGAVFGGPLTCVVLEEGGQFMLGPGGRERLF